MKKIILVIVLFGSINLIAEESVKPEKNSVRNDPRSIIENIFLMAKNDLIKKDKKLQKEISLFVDFKTMTTAALGKRRGKLTEAQQNWFDDALKEIITKTVYPKAPGFLKDVKISYRNEKIKGSKSSILSVIKQKGEITEVNYKMKKTNNKWRVVDIAIDDDSWVESIQEEVFDVLDAEKWAGLKKRLTKRLSQLK